MNPDLADAIGRNDGDSDQDFGGMPLPDNFQGRNDGRAAGDPVVRKNHRPLGQVCRRPNTAHEFLPLVDDTQLCLTLPMNILVGNAESLDRFIIQPTSTLF
jgi:hypothetical protein